MEFSFANQLGLWALVGIPIVVLIHFLQRQSQEVTISTLFLLQQMQRESVEGRKFERLRSSVPLWLQLLMVCLLTWLLAQPRWLRSDSVQPLAIVLDESASMGAFQKEAKEQLAASLKTLSNSVTRSEFYVLGSSLSGSNLYRGADLDELIVSLEKWQPNLGEHEFEPALRVARSLVGQRGVVVLVTDQVREKLPFDTVLLATGTAKPNVGFAGLTVSEETGAPRWKAIVRNYSDEEATREWFLAIGDQRATQTITLGPGEIRSLEGPFPENAPQVTLHLAPDAFKMDDVLPLARPEPRQLVIRPIVQAALADEALQVAQSIGHSQVLDASAPDNAPLDIVISSYDPIRPALPADNAIVFMEHPLKQNQVVSGRLITTNHDLIAHLNWEPLIVRQSLQIPRLEMDTVLLWQDERPLIMLRESPGKQQLLFNFDLKGSNALRLPAFILLVHRFAERVRAQKPVLERRILETGQPLDLVVKPNLPAPGADPAAPLPAPPVYRMAFQSWDGLNDFESPIPANEISRRRAPIFPGFLSVYRGEEKILEGSTYFADTREADLRQASSQNDMGGMTHTLVERHTQVDSNWTLWLLILALVLVLSWAWIAWRQSKIVASEQANAKFGRAAA